jgi:hypothetical protein
MISLASRRIATYSGPCEILVGGAASAPGTVSLITGDDGAWYGRVASDGVDWFRVSQRADPVTIRLPSAALVTVRVTRFTYLLPREARVAGIGSTPQTDVLAPNPGPGPRDG